MRFTIFFFLSYNTNMLFNTDCTILYHIFTPVTMTFTYTMVLQVANGCTGRNMIFSGAQTDTMV